MRKGEYVLIGVIATICLFELLWISPWFRFYPPDEPSFEPNTKWSSENPKIELSSDENGFISGVFYTDLEPTYVEFSADGELANIYTFVKNDDEILDSEYNEEVLLSGEYSVTKKGDIILDIESFDYEEYKSQGINEIVLKKQLK